VAFYTHGMSCLHVRPDCRSLPGPADEPRAAADLVPLVYDELRRLAAFRLAHEMPGHTLRPTALVHEAYLRLLAAGTRWDGPRHFYPAAVAIRRRRVDAARHKGRVKRVGGQPGRVIDPDVVVAPERADDLLALDAALTAFAAVEPGIAELVTLRYFGGLTLKDAAESLGIPPHPADTHWASARVWLLAEMRHLDG
jgi:RNA polymerase sigma factor (TIGR02999 family)